jgi:DNA-binding NarL/FixJ family response regulator
MKRPNIFIIEDSQIIREAITHVLVSELDARIIALDCAEAAIAQLDVYEPDIILLDYHLDSKDRTNMTGLDFLKKLKLRDKQPFIIMISGQRDKSITTEILKSGAVNYLSKEDEGFLDNLVMEIERSLSVKSIHKNQVKQRTELKKRIIRIAAFIVIPIAIALIVNLCK